jgi:hypothetical protein
MNQILTIFRKDVRRYWPEASASIALLVAFAWVEVHGWTYRESFDFPSRGLFSFNFLSGVVNVLTPVSWIFLAVRVVHGESLVGDRQFWLTRPYDWKKLLGAKFLVLFVFINLPLLVLDLFLLSRAGFHPSNYVLGLLWMEVLVLMFVILPAAALASVTATIVQVLLSAAVIVLYVIGMVALSELIPSSGFSGPVDSFSPILLLVVCLAVILLQYSRRKAMASRLMILGLGGAFFLLLALTPYQAIVAHQFPPLRPGEQPPFQARLLSPDSSQGDVDSEERKDVEIRLPLSITGIPAEDFVNVYTVRIKFETTSGVRWDSGWQSRGFTLFPDQKSTDVRFTLKADLFKRIQSSAAKVRLFFAFTLLRDRNQREVVVPQGQFDLVDVGHCFVEAGYVPALKCLAPLREPGALLITTDASKSTCPHEPKSPPAGIARDWMQHGGSEPAEFGISPVQSFNIYVSGGTNNAGICAGTPLVLSKPEALLSGQTEIEANDISLAQYREKPLRFTFR